MLRKMMGTVSAFMATVSCAAASLPPEMVGTWSSGPLDYEGGTREIAMCFAGDGSVLMAGHRIYAAAATGGHASRPDRFARLMTAVPDGDILTVRALPGDVKPPEREHDMQLTCRMQQQAVFTCHDRRGVTFALMQRSTTITPDMAAVDRAVREQLVQHPERGSQIVYTLDTAQP